MDNSFITQLLQSLQTWPAPFLSVLSLLCTGIIVLLFLKHFQKMGLYTYIALALILANIQTLKGTHYSFFSYPIPLGMEAFASVTLCVDILAANWGTNAALKAIKLGFFAQVSMAILMFFTLAMPGFPIDLLPPSEQFLHYNHEHMMALFLPLPSLLLASWIAYGASQTLDVYIFQRFNKNKLFIRAGIAAIFATLVDHFLFNFLAWVALPQQSISNNTFWFSYIGFIYIIRVLYSFALTPILYYAKGLIIHESTSHN